MDSGEPPRKVDYPAISVPAHFYLLVLAPAVVVGGILWASYDALPDPLPVHWGFDGEPDSWEPKSVGTLLFQLLLGPGIMLFGLVMTSTFLWLQSGSLFEPGGAKSATDALRTWHETRVMAPLMGWYLTWLSLSVTLMLTGSYGPWTWLRGAAGWLSAAGMVGMVAATVWLFIVMARETAQIAAKYPHSDGRRRKWGLFVELPGERKVMIDTGNGSNYTFNTATRTGRILAVTTLVLLGGSGVLLLVLAGTAVL